MNEKLIFLHLLPLFPATFLTIWLLIHSLSLWASKKKSFVYGTGKSTVKDIVRIKQKYELRDIKK